MASRKFWTVFEAGYGSPGAEKYAVRADSGGAAIRRVMRTGRTDRDPTELYAVAGRGPSTERKFFRGRRKEYVMLRGVKRFGMVYR